MGTQFIAGLRLRASSAAIAAMSLFAPALSAQAGGTTADEPSESRLLYSSRLSILNGGGPRNGEASGSSEIERGTNPFAERSIDLSRARWKFSSDSQTPTPNAQRSPAKGQPISGDFDGDGQNDFGLFVDGQWYIDLNGNGAWDADDLWAQLGGAGDQPLVGDWDGDGKADIGVFGLDAATESDAGLPDAQNDNASRQTTSGARAVRLAQRGAEGSVQAEPVDHVLVYGAEPAIAVAGDFNGDGVDTIALFRDGRWFIDSDGNGQPSDADFDVLFGEAGDVPVAGDFDGDGIDELAVYRDGRWIVRGRADESPDRDVVIELGGSQSTPVVGDFDGDGQDDQAVYDTN